MATSILTVAEEYSSPTASSLLDHSPLRQGGRTCLHSIFVCRYVSPSNPDCLKKDSADGARGWGGICVGGGDLRPEQTSEPLSTSMVRIVTINNGDVA